MSRVNVYCPSEKLVLGYLELEKNSVIDSSKFMKNYKHISDENHRINRVSVSDYQQLMCPHCFGPLKFKSEQNEVYAFPGSIKTE